MQPQLAISLALSVISLIFASVMMAGSSDNCDILMDVAWGKAEEHAPTDKYVEHYVDGPIPAFYLGTKGLCTTDTMLGLLENARTLPEVNDPNSLARGAPPTDSADVPSRFTLNEGAQKFQKYTESGADFGSYDASSCADSGKIATGFTALALALTVIITLISIARLNKTSTASGLKSVAVVLPILAITADIVAIGHFDDKCISGFGGSDAALFRNDTDLSADPSVGVILGFIMVLLLTFTTILQAVAK